MAKVLRGVSLLVILFSLQFNFGEAQDEIKIAFEMVADVATVDLSFDNFRLSPSGGKLVVVSRENLCITDLENSTDYCDPLPWGDVYTKVVPNLEQIYIEWSPNENYISLAKYPFCCDRWDTDIWLYDLESREFANLTEDDVENFYITSEAEVLNIPIDFLPKWDSLSQFIYFFRAYPDDIGRWFDKFGLYRVAIADNSIESIYDLTEELKPPIYAASISPDNARFVMLVGGSEVNASSLGIWELDLIQNTLDHVIAPDKFNEILLQGLDDVGFSPFSSIAWGDNNQLYTVVQGFDTDANSRPTNFHDLFFVVKLENTTLQPLAPSLVDSNFRTTTVYVGENAKIELIIVAEPDNKIQKLYYRNSEDGFQLVDELPYYGWQHNDRVVQISKNNTILSGGLLISLPQIP